MYLKMLTQDLTMHYIKCLFRMSVRILNPIRDKESLLFLKTLNFLQSDRVNYYDYSQCLELAMLQHGFAFLKLEIGM